MAVKQNGWDSLSKSQMAEIATILAAGRVVDGRCTSRKSEVCLLPSRARKGCLTSARIDAARFDADDVTNSSTGPSRFSTCGMMISGRSSHWMRCRLSFTYVQAVFASACNTRVLRLSRLFGIQEELNRGREPQKTRSCHPLRSLRPSVQKESPARLPSEASEFDRPADRCLRCPEDISDRKRTLHDVHRLGPTASAVPGSHAARAIARRAGSAVCRSPDCSGRGRPARRQAPPEVGDLCRPGGRPEPYRHLGSQARRTGRISRRVHDDPDQAGRRAAVCGSFHGKRRSWIGWPSCGACSRSRTIII